MLIKKGSIILFYLVKAYFIKQIRPRLLIINYVVTTWAGGDRRHRREELALNSFHTIHYSFLCFNESTENTDMLAILASPSYESVALPRACFFE